MNKQGKRNNRGKKGKQAQGPKKEDSDGSWEEMLNAPLPSHDTLIGGGPKKVSMSTKTKATGLKAAEDEWEDDDETTMTTTDSTKAVMGKNRTDGQHSDEAEEEGDRTGKKKRKKRANKRTVAKLKEMRKIFIERCVSPSYHTTKQRQLNGEINLVNLKTAFDADSERDAVYKNTRAKKGKGKKGPQASHPAGTMPQPRAMHPRMPPPHMMMPPNLPHPNMMMPPPQGNMMMGNPMMMPNLPGIPMDFIHPGMVSDPFGMPMQENYLPPNASP